MKRYILYGFGGHGRVIKDAIEKIGHQVIYVFDNENLYDSTIYPEAEIIIAIGNNQIREKISKEITHQLGTVIHPDASIGNDVVIAKGTVILANAVIQTGCRIGKNCIINANVTIDHDAVIEDFVSIYPGSYIGGEARLTKSKIVESNVVVQRKSII